MGAEFKQSISIRDLVTMALLTALLFVMQVVMAPLPNVEVVSLLILLYTKHYRKKALLIIYAFALLEGMMYGFGLWFVNYLYVWTILFLVVMILPKREGWLFHTFILTFYGLGFGTLCSIPYFFIGGWRMMASYIVAGIPFDLMHGFANGVVCAVLFATLNRLFARVIDAR